LAPYHKSRFASRLYDVKVLRKVAEELIAESAPVAKEPPAPVAEAVVAETAPAQPPASVPEAAVAAACPDQPPAPVVEVVVPEAVPVSSVTIEESSHRSPSFNLSSEIPPMPDDDELLPGVEAEPARVAAEPDVASEYRKRVNNHILNHEVAVAVEFQQPPFRNPDPHSRACLLRSQRSFFYTARRSGSCALGCRRRCSFPSAFPSPLGDHRLEGIAACRASEHARRP
jgi:hypothetical protein